MADVAIRPDGNHLRGGVAYCGERGGVITDGACAFAGCNGSLHDMKWPYNFVKVWRGRAYPAVIFQAHRDMSSTKYMLDAGNASSIHAFDTHYNISYYFWPIFSLK